MPHEGAELSLHAGENLAWIAAISYGLYQGHVNEVARNVLHERPFSRGVQHYARRYVARKPRR